MAEACEITAEAYEDEYKRAIYLRAAMEFAEFLYISLKIQDSSEVCAYHVYSSFIRNEQEATIETVD